MIKVCFFLVNFFLIGTLFSQSKREFTFYLIDAWTGNEVKNNRIRIYNQDEKMLLDSLVNEKFTFHFLDSKKLYYDIIVNNDAMYYEERKVFNTGNYDKNEVNLFLQPNEYYFAKIMQKEDSLYGKVTDIIDYRSNPTFKYPSFPGGENALNKFVDEHIIYPQKSVELGEQGKIYVLFVVEIDGKISHIYVEKGKSNELNLEARRVVNRMPKFIPATVDGKKIRSIVRLPINFILPELHPK